MMETEELTFGRVSSDAVRKATGRGWSEWLEVLDRAGGADWGHGEIVRHLELEHSAQTSSWWRQSIAVAYERARGKRAVGQTAEAAFQVGVQRTFAAGIMQVWEVVTTQADLWLGDGAAISFEQGARFNVPPSGDSPAATGEVRIVKPGDRLRMTWQLEGWPRPATLELVLSESRSGKTVIHADLQKLPDAQTRETMRGWLRAALDRIAAAVA